MTTVIFIAKLYASWCLLCIAGATLKLWLQDRKEPKA
jgi:hypothetical protein